MICEQEILVPVLLNVGPLRVRDSLAFAEAGVDLIAYFLTEDAIVVFECGLYKERLELFVEVSEEVVDGEEFFGRAGLVGPEGGGLEERDDF